MKYLYHHRTQGLNVEGVHIRSICNALINLGHQVRLVSVTSTDDDYSINPVQDKSVNPNKKQGILKSIAKRMPEPAFEFLELVYNIYAFFRLWYVIHGYKPDRIYERYSLFLFATLILGKIYNIPVIFEINDSSQLVRLRPLYFKKIASYIEKSIFSHASGLVFVSQKLKNIIIGAYPDIETNQLISPNASNKDTFYFNKEEKEVAKKHLSVENKIVCGFIGCFAPWHGVDRFMKSIAPELKKHPKLTLLLIGDGETLSVVESIKQEYDLENQVILTGNIPHGNIISYVRAMDFSILPSSNEYGSPMKMFELMGAGVPLIAADYPPIREILEDGKNGWLFPKNDFNECIKTLLNIYNQSDTIEKAALEAQDKIHKKHQWSNNASNLENLFILSKKTSEVG